MKITQKRTYEALRTTSTLSIDSKPYGATIEDIGRPYGVKIQDETCIPEGSYKVAITESARFGRPMLQLFTNPTDKSCDMGGIRFTGIRVHGGNKTSQSAGCILYQGDLTELETVIGKALKLGELVLWEIVRA